MEIWKRPSTTSWAFARRGAQRNPSATGGPYIWRTMPPGFPYRKRQNLLLQVSALLELVPAGVYAICGFRLLEKPEAKD